jgi:hypothetical protein
MSNLGPFVYYIQCGQFVKIGYSINPEDRVKQIRRGGRAARPTVWADDPKLLGYEPGARDLEASRHAQFADLHDRGEWFTLTPALAEHIEGVRQAQAVLEVKLQQEWYDHRGQRVTLDNEEQIRMSLERTSAPDLNWHAAPETGRTAAPKRDPRNQKERIARLMRAS